MELAAAAATTTTLGRLHASTLWRSAARVRRRLLPALVIKRCCIPHAMIRPGPLSTERRARGCPPAADGRRVAVVLVSVTGRRSIRVIR